MSADRATEADGLEIVSVSMPRTLLKRVDHLREELGLSSRSEVFRHAVRQFMEEYSGMRTSDPLEGALILFYVNRGNEAVQQILHSFSDAVISEMHAHCSNRLCMEIIYVSGPGKIIDDMIRALRSHRTVKSLTLIPMPDA